MGKSAVGVSNLKALAWFGRSERRAVMLDARRGQAYAAVYDAALEPVTPEVVMDLKSWLGSLDEADYEFIAEARFRSELAGARFARMPFVEAPRQLAGAVSACAEMLGGVDPAALDANYVRRSDAELFCKDG
jgi:tRNA threonylcarbamoyladenosine biosynthesis protein TsaB